MVVDVEKQRARWQRNKRAERLRKTAQASELSEQFIKAVLEERDRRATQTPYAGHLWRQAYYFKDGSWEKAIAFAADVWAADYCIVTQFGKSGLKPKRVIDWLNRYGFDHGYTQKSLGKMIHKARTRVKLLESKVDFVVSKRPVWSAFVLPKGRKSKSSSRIDL